MNIGSFLHRDQALYGVFNGETVAPASPGLIAQYPTLRDLLDAEKSAQYLHKKYPNLTKIFYRKKTKRPEIKLLHPKKTKKRAI